MKKITILLALLFVINWASAQVDIVEPAQPTPSSDVEIKPQTSLAPTADDNSLLWEISGNDLEKSSYLYGTIHMIGKDDFFLTDKTKETFEKSEKVVFEIDMSKMNDMSVMFSLIGQVMMKDGVGLKDLLSEEDYKLVSDHFTEMGLPMFMFEKVKPMFLASMASGDMSGDMTGGGGGMASGDIVSYEMEFMEMAKTQEKEMDGLETIAYQMSVFDSIPYEDQAKMLVESISSEVVGDSQFDEMVEMYKKQDLSGMQEMFAADEEGIGKYEDIFLKNRNENWIPVMKEMMAAKPTFFAVGAGHLGGNIGVIALLRKAGYEVKALY